MASQHPFDVTPRIRLIPPIMEGEADHSVGDRQVDRVGLVFRQVAESLSQRESGSKLAAVHAVDPKPPERPQLVLEVGKPLGDLKSPSAGRFGLVRRTSREQQRRAKRRTELHLAVGIGKRCGRRDGERLFGAPSTLLDQGRLHPQRHRGRGKRDAKLRLCVRRKCPIERRPNVIDVVPVIGQHIECGTRLPFGLGPLEDVTIIFRVPLSDGSKLAGMGQLFQSVSARRIEQAMMGRIATDIGRDQRLRGKIGDTFVNMAVLIRSSAATAAAASIVKSP